MNTTVYKGNTFLLTRVGTLNEWTIRNTSHNTFIGEIALENGILTSTAALGRARRTVSASIVKNEQEMLEWAVRVILDDKRSVMK